jgi:hypothetical protein
LAEQRVGVADEHFKPVPLSGGEPNLFVSQRHSPGGEVDPYVAELDYRRRISLSGAARRGAARSRAISSSIPNGLVT